MSENYFAQWLDLNLVILKVKLDLVGLIFPTCILLDCLGVNCGLGGKGCMLGICEMWGFVSGNSGTASQGVILAGFTP